MKLRAKPGMSLTLLCPWFLLGLNMVLDFASAVRTEDPASFVRMRETLSSGRGIITSITDLTQCFLLEGLRRDEKKTEIPSYVLMDQILSWTIMDEDDKNQASISTNQVYVDSGGRWILLGLTVTSVNVTLVDVAIVDPVSHELVESFDMWCHVFRDAGRYSGGSFFSSQAKELEYEELEDYLSLKTALVLGRPVIVTMDLKSCEGIQVADASLFSGVQGGFLVDDWDIAPAEGRDSFESLVLRSTPIIQKEDGEYVASFAEIVIHENDGVVYPSKRPSSHEASNSDAQGAHDCRLGRTHQLSAKAPIESKSFGRHVIVTSAANDYFEFGVTNLADNLSFGSLSFVVNNVTSVVADEQKQMIF